MKTNIKFFQVLTTNRFKSSLDRQYTSVFNYASLAAALRNMRMVENKNVADGITYIDNITGEKVCQHHLTYEEDGAAVIELRHEFFGIPEGCTVEQVVNQQSMYIKEINL